MSHSVALKSPRRHHSSRRSVSPERDYDSPRRREKSPIKSSHSKSPSHVERSPARRKSSHKERGSSPARERYCSRTKSPRREKSNSPVSRSPSPRTKRLKRAHAEREVEKASEEHTRNHDKGGDKSKRERSYKDVEDEVVKDRREHRSEREKERVRERDQDKDKGKDIDRIKDRERDRDRGRARDRDRDRDRNRNRDRDRDRERDRAREKEGADDGSARSRHRSRSCSRSPPQASNSRSRDEDSNLQEDETRNDGSDSLSKMKAAEEALSTKEKHQPQFGLSGKLAEETNRVRGVTLLFNEPPDARKPDMRWRLYVFKNGDVLNEPLYVHRQSCYLFGRERRVADIPTDHPSCSKQHAVLQFRQVEKEQPDGMMAKQIRPYLMDLGSTNKTFLNDNPIEPQRYYELLEKDTIKFGNSSREYVLLHEQSAG